jgi:hypothetical protein
MEQWARPNMAAWREARITQPFNWRQRKAIRVTGRTIRRLSFSTDTVTYRHRSRKLSSQWLSGSPMHLVHRAAGAVNSARHSSRDICWCFDAHPPIPSVLCGPARPLSPYVSALTTRGCPVALHRTESWRRPCARVHFRTESHEATNLRARRILRAACPPGTRSRYPSTSSRIHTL